MMGMMGSCMASMGFFGLLLVLGLVAAGFAVAALLARRTPGVLQPAAWPALGEDPALATLRERFARGEIDRTEYEERRRTLVTRDADWA